MKVLLFLSLISFSLVAQAQLDNGLTPLQRYDQGQRTQGAFSLDNWIMCSQKARNQYVPEVVNDETILTVTDQGALITAAGQNSIVTDVINQSLDSLARQGDTKTLGRHVCVGFYFGAPEHVTGNASSHTFGYLLFDYRAIENLYSIKNRSFWVHHYLILHELAHQLQYWNNDQEVQKTFQGLQTAKKPELAADCLAGALFRLNHLGLTKDLYDLSFKGVLEGAALIGDHSIGDPGHHGTPAERRFATGFGSSLVAEFEQELRDGTLRVTSEYLLNRCNAFITKAMP